MSGWTERGAGLVETPLGPFRVVVAGGRVETSGWVAAGAAGAADSTGGALEEALAQVRAYFDGTRGQFDLDLAPVRGFAAEMRAAMCAIPFGETRTYGEIARDLGVSAQAVGQGCGANPLPLIVPCHRVLGANGLGGYSGRGGVETKVALLRHERAGGILI